jgi:hypothetical protein
MRALCYYEALQEFTVSLVGRFQTHTFLTLYSRFCLCLCLSTDCFCFDWKAYLSAFNREKHLLEADPLEQVLAETIV